MQIMDVIARQRVSPSCTSSPPPPPPHLWGIAAVPAGTYWALTGLFGLRHLLFQGRNAVVTAHCSDHSRYWTNQGGVYKVVKGVHGKPVRCTAAHATSIAVLYIYIYCKHQLPSLSRTYTHTQWRTYQHTRAPAHTCAHKHPPPPSVLHFKTNLFENLSDKITASTSDRLWILFPVNADISW